MVVSKFGGLWRGDIMRFYCNFQKLISLVMQSSISKIEF